MPKASRSVQWVVQSTAALGVLSLLFVLFYTGFSFAGLNWALAGFLFILAIFTESLHVTVRHGSATEEFTLVDIAITIAVLTLPPSAAVVTVSGAMVVVGLIRRRVLVKSVFNVGVHLAGVSAGVVVFHAIVHTSTTTYTSQLDSSPRVIVAIVAAMATFSLVNQALILRILIAVTNERISLQRRLPATLLASIGSAAIGTIAVVVFHSSPVLLPFAVLAGVGVTYLYVTTSRQSQAESRSSRLLAISSLLATRLGVHELVPSFLSLLVEAFPTSRCLVIQRTPDGLMVSEGHEGETKQRPATEEDEQFYEASTSYRSPAYTRSPSGERVVIAPLGSPQSGAVVLVAAGTLRSSLSSQDAALLAPLVSSLEAAIDAAALFEHVQAITTSQGEAVLALDRSGVVTFANPAACRLLGLPEERAVGSVLAEQVIVLGSKERRTVLDLISDTPLHGLDDDDASLCMEEVEIPISFTLTPISSYGRDATSGVVLVMRDVTERRHAREELLSRQDQLVALGRTLQQALLPPLLPEIPGFSVSARYHSGSAGLDVGGDFYDLIDLPDKTWVVVMGDVCGRGAQAAALTSLTRHTIRGAAMRESSPVAMLETLNQAILRHHGDDRFCTVLAGHLVPDSQGAELEVSCGGHPPGILVHADGSIRKVGKKGTLLGVFEDVSLRSESVRLVPGDYIVFYTDGVLEARDEAGQFFENLGLVDTLTSAAGKSADEVAEILDTALREFQGGSVADDTAFLVLAVDG